MVTAGDLVLAGGTNDRMFRALQSGWGVDAERIQDALFKGNLGTEDHLPEGGVVRVFALRK